MRIMHLKSLASLAVLLALACEAAAQPYRPFETGVTEEDGQPFAGFEYDDYNGGPPPRQGWFFNYERVVMWINAPKQATVGQDTTVDVVAGSGWRTEESTMNTGYLDADRAWGNRYEFGYVEGDDGWLCSILDGQPQDQLTDRTSFQSELRLRQDIDVVFTDPPYGTNFGPHGWLDGFVNMSRAPGSSVNGVIIGPGVDEDLDGDGLFGRFYDGDGDGVINPFLPIDNLDANAYDYDDLARLPVLFNFLRARNKAYMESVELMRTHYVPPLHNGGRVQFMYGVKFFKFRDRFNVFATGGVLAESFWNQLADNNVVGPEIGLRYYQTKDRWEFAGEARGLLGVNFMTLEQTGRLGSLLSPVAGLPGTEGSTTNRPTNTPAFMDPTGFNHAFHSSVFAPGAELRFVVSYNVTADVALRAGYTGMYNYGIARASNTIDYVMPTMGITTDNVRQSLWVNMLTFGFEWNR